MLNFSQLSLAMIWSRIVLDTEFHGDLHSVFFLDMQPSPVTHKKHAH
jgi:hypothetical protein